MHSATCAALGLELYLGMPRDGGLAEDPQATDLGRAEALRAGYVPIPWHDLARQKHRPPICVDQGWLDRLKLDVSTLAMVQPAHLIGGKATTEFVAIVDRAARAATEAQTWAFIERGTVTVGVIQNERPALVLHGAEYGATSRLVTDKEREAITLLGRVVWSGQMTPSAPR